jgi:hypothetical protein
MVGRFVTRRKSRPVSKRNGSKTHTYAEKLPAEMPGLNKIQGRCIAHLRGDKEAPNSGGCATVRSVAIAANAQTKAGNNLIEALKLLAADGRGEDQEDVTVHCIAVSEVCFKIGRITIPPALVFSSDGMTTVPSSIVANGTPSQESRTSAPPHWDHVRKLRLDKDKFVRLMTGGWRDVPNGEKWWEDAFKGEGETKRLANLEALEVIRNGMNAVETL